MGRDARVGSNPTGATMKCNKRKYKDKIAAMFALASCRSARKGTRMERRMYYCDKCEAWHLTSKIEYDKGHL